MLVLVDKTQQRKLPSVDFFDFFAASGALAWIGVAWWSYRQIAHVLARLRWALWGYHKRHKRMA